MNRPASCDIFCNVIDNYGDIGVCWRLARQLAHEHGIAVRLWVDDLVSMQKLCPEVVPQLALQYCRSVEVRHWLPDAFIPLPQSSMRERRGEGLGAGTDVIVQHVIPAELVVEAFACELPEHYVAAMAMQRHKPVWLNLEYLSAEDWVAECHGLPSPHPRLPLLKHFFFPGFTTQTGGLLLEHGLFAQRDAFQNDPAQQQAYWHSLGIEMPSDATLKISLFGYENAAVAGLFDAWAAGSRPVLCLVPEGRILLQVGHCFGDDSPCAGKVYTCGKLTVRVLSFVEQERYDLLLWACDVNFVRGEDSCVRAQWAARPFIWQIYPQNDAVHWDKLLAFLKLYTATLEPTTGQALQTLWQEWNREGVADRAWPAFAAVQDELKCHAAGWAQQMSGNNLVLNLLDFYKKNRIMQGFQN